MPYVHLKPNDRVLLSGYLRAGLKQQEIAELLGKHPSTVNRELSRNRINNLAGYDARLAKKKTKERRIKANQRFRKIENYPWLEQKIEEKLKLYWSPEQIAGRLRREFGRTVVCHETIYQWIYQERSDLKRYLRCQKGKYRRRYGTKIREERRKKKEAVRRIDQRPKIVEERGRIGDWEGDTIIGKGRSRKGALLTHVDRRSGKLLADKLKQATAEEVREKTVRKFKQIPKKKRETLTYDNGSEFADHELVERELEIAIYFANPHHSWERGTNENTNGLLRQFFPKKRSLKDITQSRVTRVVKLINNRPKKRLNYLTPEEVFEENCVLG